MTKKRNEASDKEHQNQDEYCITIHEAPNEDDQNHEECCTTLHVRYCLLTLGIASCSTISLSSNVVARILQFAAGACLYLASKSDVQYEPEDVRNSPWYIIFSVRFYNNFSESESESLLPPSSDAFNIPMCGLVRGIANTTNRINKAANCCAKAQTEQPESPTMSRY